LACQDEFFVNTALHVKETVEHALDFTLHLSRLLPVFHESTTPRKRPCTAHAFFHERLSNHCQSLHRTFPEICTKFDSVSLSDSYQMAWGKIHVYKWKDVKISTSTQQCEILYTDSQDMLVLSSAVASRYYNYCIGGCTSHGNYWYSIHIVCSTIWYIYIYIYQFLD
jgi:hypothetical protein